MAQPNYRQARKQKELARKTRQEEKLRKRLAKPGEGEATPAADGDAVDAPATLPQATATPDAG